MSTLETNYSFITFPNNGFWTPANVDITASRSGKQLSNSDVRDCCLESRCKTSFGFTAGEDRVVSACWKGLVHTNDTLPYHKDFKFFRHPRLSAIMTTSWGLNVTVLCISIAATWLIF